jgi:hypothetical protein
MAPTGTAMLMMVAANRNRPLVRPKREIHPYQDMDIDALPGLGVYWDTNMLIRQKGETGANGSTSEDKMTTRPASEVDGQDTSNTIPDHEEAIPADYGDHQDRALVSKGSVPQSMEHLETGDELLAHTNSFLHKQLYTSGKELREQGDVSLGSEGYPPGDTEITTTKYHEYYEFRPTWDYYQDDEYDGTPYAVSSLAAEPGDGGSASDKYPSVNFGNYVWSIVTSVSKRIEWNVMVDQCYELVVCEAHRVGSAWGDSGMLLASGVR